MLEGPPLSNGMKPVFIGLRLVSDGTRAQKHWENCNANAEDFRNVQGHRASSIREGNLQPTQSCGSPRTTRLTLSSLRRLIIIGECLLKSKGSPEYQKKAGREGDKWEREREENVLAEKRDLLLGTQEGAVVVEGSGVVLQRQCKH